MATGLPTAASEGRNKTNGGMPRLESRKGKIWPRWRRDAVPPQLSCPALWRQQDHVYTCRCICLQLQSHCFGLMPLVVLHAHQTKTWPFQRSLWNWFSSQRFFHGRPTPSPIPKPDSTPFWERVVSDLRPPRIQKPGRGAPKLAPRNHRGKPRYKGKGRSHLPTQDQQLRESNNSKRDSWQEFTPGDSKWPFWDGENMTFLRS